MDAATWGVPAFAIMNLWLVGGSMLVYLAGLRNIPTEQYEAASIDGARWWRRFRNVTLPMLSPVILFNVIMAIIGSFQVFTQAFVMTGGGPGDDTRFYVLYLYNLAFDVYEMGYASALAWVLLIVILILTAHSPSPLSSFAPGAPSSRVSSMPAASRKVAPQSAMWMIPGSEG